MEWVYPFFFFSKNLYDSNGMRRGSSYIVWVWWFGAVFLVSTASNHPRGIKCTASWRVGPRGGKGAHTLVGASPCRLRLVDSCMDLDPCHASVLAQVWCMNGLLLLFCLNTPFWSRILVSFHLSLCKTCIYQNSWKMWVVNSNSKFWHSFLFILFKCWR